MEDKAMHCASISNYIKSEIRELNILINKSRLKIVTLEKGLELLDDLGGKLTEEYLNNLVKRDGVIKDINEIAEQDTFYPNLEKS